jgi:hypothetical protein
VKGNLIRGRDYRLPFPRSCHWPDDQIVPEGLLSVVVLADRSAVLNEAPIIYCAWFASDERQRL